MSSSSKTVFKKHVVIPVFIPHKGCPHDCIFCNQKKISGSISEVTKEDVYRIIDNSLKTINHQAHTEIRFYGGSFTGIEKEKQLEFLKTAGFFVEEGKVASVRISTRPDYINPEILTYLKENYVKTIELGVQSLDEEVLIASNRGHTPEDVYYAALLIKEYGFTLGIQTMTGLPGDTPQKDIETAKKVIGLSPEIVRIYPALVIRGTYMELLYRTGKYKPQELSEAVDICAKLLKMYRDSGINVIRLGLQTNESINDKADVIAGPFHPAFRQLVESRLMLETIEEKLSDLISCENGSMSIKNKKLLLYADPRNISNVACHKRCNIEYLKSKYGFREIKIICEPRPAGNILVELK